ncbi:GNAT family N-acetyltransferase [Micromonospora zhanjiangensis]|uniref:GNAT family N-acetyltransferase n=1 Tax=Micromonospora zhanjiangensis TaxID=1522057 RepID=A0ABV8KIF8_9ACTN
MHTSAGPHPPTIEFAVARPDSAPARAILRTYYVDIVGRYHGRSATDAEVESAMGDAPSHDLVPPTGEFLLARLDGTVVGCAGLRLLPAGVGELTRVFLAPAARGRGLAARLVRRVEQRAAGLGVRTLRMDTRADLIEARRLYARLGYREVEPFNDDPYADHFFAKELAGA